MPLPLILCACGAILRSGTVGNIEIRETCECPPAWVDPSTLPGFQEALLAKRDEELRLAKANKTSRVSEDDRPGRWYFITYTRPPQYFDPKHVLDSTRRLLRSKAVAPIQWAYSLELQKNRDTTHTHTIIHE